MKCRKPLCSVVNEQIFNMNFAARCSLYVYVGRGLLISLGLKSDFNKRKGTKFLTFNYQPT